MCANAIKQNQGSAAEVGATPSEVSGTSGTSGTSASTGASTSSIGGSEGQSGQSGTTRSRRLCECHWNVVPSASTAIAGMRLLPAVISHKQMQLLLKKRFDGLAGLSP